MKNYRQPLEILKETAMILNSVPNLDSNARELATNPAYSEVSESGVEKIIRSRLAVYGVPQEAIEHFVCKYMWEKVNA
jgi:hypothetical protein